MARPFIAGLGCSVAVGLFYLFALHEPGALFYAFAILAFAGGPCVAGLLAARGARPSGKAFVAAGAAVFGAVFALFLFTYTLWPQFESTSVRLPPFCTDGVSLAHPPAFLSYAVPGSGERGILIARGEGRAVVVVPADAPPHPSRVFVIDTNANRVLNELTFPSDVVMAAIDGGMTYIYNNRLGIFLDARTGRLKPVFFTIDNYSGLSRVAHPVLPHTPGTAWYVETDAVISSWGVDGSVRSRPHMFLNAVAQGCYVNGKTERITKL
jgi:hypothetical protein